LDELYSGYFGLNEEETKTLLAFYDLELDEQVKQKYDGYLFCNTEIYNPWSILNYAKSKRLDSFWINTSTNHLVRKSIAEADDFFSGYFDRLIADGTAVVYVNLGCSFIELKHSNTLWGLLINAGYITVVRQIDEGCLEVRIPNGEVKNEFSTIVADRANIRSEDLYIMFNCLLQKDLDGFMNSYREIVLTCTSYFDAKENAYHMLFLGMCITLNNIYKITSNIEAGHGKSDIRMESLFPTERPHIIIEFKQGKNLDKLKTEALEQIMENKYCAGLKGEILCLGLAHDKKRCELAYEMLTELQQ
jgi:hypothetical protein